MKTFVYIWMIFTLVLISLPETLCPAPRELSPETHSPVLDDIDLAAGILDIGTLVHTVYNNGQLGTWVLSGYSVPDLPCGWYKGYGYIAGFNLWVGIPEGPWNPPGIEGPTVTEAQIHGGTDQSDWGPRFGSLGWFHSGDVVAGDLIPHSRFPDIPLMATSTLPATWPEGYFDGHGIFIATPGERHWPGFWAVDPLTTEGIEGVFAADQEVFFSMTDDGYADRDEQLDQGFSIGLQCDVAAFAFKASYARDILFFKAKAINTSLFKYEGMFIGLYLDADIEDRDSSGTVNDNEDWTKLLLKEVDPETEDTIRYDLGFIYDFRPEPNWRAYAGVTLLGSPKDTTGQEVGLSDWHWFDWYDRPGALTAFRKELIQYKVLSGDTTDLRPEEQEAYFHPDAAGRIDPHYDDWEQIPGLYPNGLDCAFLMSTGPFALEAGGTTEVAFALVMGDDEEDMKLNTKTAHAMYDYGFRQQGVTLLSPNGGEVLAGPVDISWTAHSITEQPFETVDLWGSSDGGSSWFSIASKEENDGLASWNTEEVPDGTQYCLAVSTTDGYLPGEDRSDSLFTINNPGHAVPEIRLLSPNGGENIQGVFEIAWWARDADGDELTIDIFYRSSENSAWESVALDEENDGRYLWDPWVCGSGDGARIRVVASDGDTTGEDISNGDFTLVHERSEIEAVHISGHGNGEVHVLVVDSTRFTGHAYQLGFVDTADVKIYNIFDRGLAQFVVRDQIDMTGRVESPEFDGLRVLIRDWTSISIIDSLTGWTAGDCNWDFRIQRFQPRPADYEIRFTVAGDTSITNFIPVPFEISNLTEQYKVQFMIHDTDDSKDWSSGDVIILTEPFPDYTWRITLSSPEDEDPIDPQPGAILSLIVTKPFTGEDVFNFSTQRTEVIPGQVAQISPETYRLFQNYPNPFNPRTDIRYQIPDMRSPSHTTLKVFNILGQEVRTLVDEARQAGSHTATWDGRDGQGREVASGIYFYRIEVGQFSDTKRMVFLK
ncbi:MAG: T9SS type A sorting domain-containing protein [Gemmatimonadota bacterium]|nr:MAG: T9SS type A sorting domain-containing protein [Gemmatimonadota bacterium]